MFTEQSRRAKSRPELGDVTDQETISPVGATTLDNTKTLLQLHEAGKIQIFPGNWGRGYCMYSEPGTRSFYFKIHPRVLDVRFEEIEVRLRYRFYSTRFVIRFVTRDFIHIFLLRQRDFGYFTPLTPRIPTPKSIS